MTTREAIAEATTLYEEIKRDPGTLDVYSKEHERALAIISIAEFLLKHGNSGFRS